MRDSAPTIIGRYALFDEIASGGMATVHMGRLIGAAGFSRMVAIKRLHSQYAKDPDFVSMFIDEARLAARIRHPNVVPTLDVVQTADELFLVMEYVTGDSLARLLEQARERAQPAEPRVSVAIVAGMLHGLHAAHTAKGERGEPLEIVHRDVSPQNVIVGIDGVPRVLDFGIAKATVRLQTTRDGQIKGKLAYMAPEQLSGAGVTPATDVYAASLVLWEALANKRLFQADHEAALLAMVLGGTDEPPSVHQPDVPEPLDQLVMRGLSAKPSERFATAREMALALEGALPAASSAEVGQWVEALADETLSQRAARISIIEGDAEMESVAELLRTMSGTTDRTSKPRSEEVTRLSAQDSQASSLSVARSQRLPPAMRPVRTRMIGLGLLALVAGGGLALFLLGDGERTGDASVAPSVASSAGPAPAQETARAAPTPDAPSAPPPPSVAARPDASASAAPRATAASAAPRATAQAARPPHSPSRPAVKPPASNCNPPYTVDADGIRHIKPHCVE